MHHITRATVDPTLFHPLVLGGLPAQQRFGSGFINSGYATSILGWVLIQIRIQGFDDQKLKKITVEKKFDQKLLLTYALGYVKDVQTTGGAFSPQTRTSSTSKHKIYKLFSFSVGHFSLPD
jgi:hypothetical protein